MARTPTATRPVAAARVPCYPGPDPSLASLPCQRPLEIRLGGPVRQTGEFAGYLKSSL
jgi:hypothetical protein